MLNFYVAKDELVLLMLLLSPPLNPRPQGTTMYSLQSPGDQIQGFLNARQALHQLS